MTALCSLPLKTQPTLTIPLVKEVGTRTVAAQSSHIKRRELVGVDAGDRRTAYECVGQLATSHFATYHARVPRGDPKTSHIVKVGGVGGSFRCREVLGGWSQEADSAD